MKGLLRTYLINLGALWVSTQIFPAIAITGGPRGLLIAGLAFMLANILLVPLLKILLLPLNLITLGLFAWLANVLALYLLVTLVPTFSILPYQFLGFYYQGFSIPAIELSPFYVVVVASFLIGFIIHSIHWLLK